MAGFSIPNSTDALVPGQASPDSQDVAAITQGFDLTGVISGCAVTPSSGLTIAIAAGIVIVSGKPVAVTATTKTHEALQAQARYDLVVCSSAGVVSITKGTYAANPVFPAISGALLAAVYIPATGATPTVLSSWITDKRVMIRQPDEHLAYLYF